jgi:hypothetical protein
VTNKNTLLKDNDKPFAHHRSLKEIHNRIIDYEKLSPAEIKRYKRIENSQLVKSIRERRLYYLRSDILDNKQEHTVVKLPTDDNFRRQQPEMDEYT